PPPEPSKQQGRCVEGEGKSKEDVIPGPADLTLFAHTFRTPGSAREFFARQGWDFDEVEYTYLAHSAAQAPGKFPEALGPDYPPKGEAFLLARSEKEEGRGNKEQARECVEVLLRL